MCTAKSQKTQRKSGNARRRYLCEKRYRHRRKICKQNARKVVGKYRKKTPEILNAKQQQSTAKKASKLGKNRKSNQQVKSIAG